MNIIRATQKEIDYIAELFAQYRCFYEQEYDLNLAKEFLNKRLFNEDSVIFLAIDGSKPLGFVQLYSSFTSVGLQEIWILNDLFVEKQYRGQGVAEMLINQVLEFSKITGRKRVILSTAYTNNKAQRLYEKLGFIKTEFYNYEKETN